MLNKAKHLYFVDDGNVPARFATVLLEPLANLIMVICKIFPEPCISFPST